MPETLNRALGVCPMPGALNPKSTRKGGGHTIEGWKHDQGAKGSGNMSAHKLAHVGVLYASFELSV